jgi:hypothetical protein
MRTLCGIVLAAALALTALPAQAQAPVNIVYPISGATYPIIDPAPGPLHSAYFTSSFSATCAGGAHKVEWGFDAAPAVGNATFYDQYSAQFVHKLPGGTHLFWVKSDCGSKEVRFRIGH